MELKTLKDLKAQEGKIFEMVGKLVSERELKQEAIKWVKSHDNIYGDENPARDMFMEFFNITEEDLK